MKLEVCNRKVYDLSYSKRDFINLKKLKKYEGLGNGEERYWTFLCISFFICLASRSFSVNERKSC